MALLGVGLNHKTAPVAVRERLAFADQTLAEPLARWHDPAVEEVGLFGILRGGDFLSKQRVTVHAKARSRPEVASHTKYSRCQPL